MAKKTYNGTSNNKLRSMKRLLTAVGTIIKTKGYIGLGPTNIAKCAGLNKRLIYFYFGNVENLVETYVRGKDYWVSAMWDASELMKGNKNRDTKEILEALLFNQFDYFFNEKEMQKIVLWQLSENSKIMYDVCEEREQLGARFFELTDPFFEETEVDLRATSGLLVAGIYYLILHAKANDSLFCQIDVNTTAGKERIKKAVHLILEDTYKRVDITNKKQLT